MESGCIDRDVSVVLHIHSFHFIKGWRHRVEYGHEHGLALPCCIHESDGTLDLLSVLVRRSGPLKLSPAFVEHIDEIGPFREIFAECRKKMVAADSVQRAFVLYHYAHLRLCRKLCSPQGRHLEIG